MLVSSPFFQGLSICILVRCSLQQITNYLLIFTSFSWCKRAIYSRNSSLWPLRSRKLTGLFKSPEICRGWRGGYVLHIQKKLRDLPEWFIFDNFSNIAIPNVDIYTRSLLWVKMDCFNTVKFCQLSPIYNIYVHI